MCPVVAAATGPSPDEQGTRIAAVAAAALPAILVKAPAGRGVSVKPSCQTEAPGAPEGGRAGAERESDPVFPSRAGPAAANSAEQLSVVDRRPSAPCTIGDRAAMSPSVATSWARVVAAATSSQARACRWAVFCWRRPDRGGAVVWFGVEGRGVCRSLASLRVLAPGSGGVACWREDAANPGTGAGTGAPACGPVVATGYE